jgi:RNA polymerase sigma factor (sigma-70 family)
MEAVHRPEPMVAVDRVFLRPGSSTSEHDQLVWDAFRSGSREALDAIFRTHVSGLYAYGSKFSKDRETVLDCIQDLFVELWNRRQSISSTNCIRYYLLKGLRRRITRVLHGTKRIETASQMAGYLDESVDFSAEHILVAQETEQTTRLRLKRAVESLTRRLDNASIAEVMGLTEASVHTLISQAVRALRSVF